LLLAKLLRYSFYRIHNSHLINLKYIERYIKGEGGQVRFTNGTLPDVAHRKKDEFLKLIAVRCPANEIICVASGT